MNAEEAKRLQPGDRVIWKNNSADKGIVKKVGPTGLSISWEMYLKGKSVSLHFYDCQDVSRLMEIEK